MRLAWTLALSTVILASCSNEKASSGAGGSTSHSSSEATTTIQAVGSGGTGGAGGAPSPPPLPIIPNQGGPVIASPEVITMTWQGDPIESDLIAFDEWMVPSAFFSTLMAEWGVGPGTHGGAFSITTPAPGTLDDTAIRGIVQDAITQGSVPPPNGSRIYTVYPPPGTVVTNFGEAGCVGFQAYHSAFAANLPAGGTALAVYAVTPRCANTQTMTPTDYTTWGQSHEVMEASSDPNPMSLAWVITKQTENTPELGENADLCTGNPMKIDGHVVTRNYSNVAAAAGKRPCVPAPDGPMFGAFSSPGSVSMKNGDTTTIPIHLYATGPLPAFQVYAYPLNPAITATLDQAQGSDGDVLSLSISVAANYIEIPGQNIIQLTSVSNGYPTYRFVVVHRIK